MEFQELAGESGFKTEVMMTESGPWDICPCFEDRRTAGPIGDEVLTSLSVCPYNWVPDRRGCCQVSIPVSFQQRAG